MKILLTTPYCIVPANYGGAVRTTRMAEALKSLGHDVAVLSAHVPLGDNYAFKGHGGVSYFINPALIREAKRVIGAFNPELIVAAFPYQSLMLVRLARSHGIPLVYDAHNIEQLRFRRMNRPVVARLIGLFEDYMIRNARAVLCVSEEEAAHVKARFDTPTLLVPNGVNPPDTVATEREFTFCFFGALDYAPNIQALAVIRENWPVIRSVFPQARLLLVGRSPPPWCRSMPGWQVTGEVDDVTKTIAQARILLCPITEGGGSRLKIIEAVANGLLVVSTRFGAEGFEPLVAAGSIVTAPLQEFAQAAVDAANEDINPCSVSASASPYDWKALVRQIETLDDSAADLDTP